MSAEMREPVALASNRPTEPEKKGDLIDAQNSSFETISKSVPVADWNGLCGAWRRAVGQQVPPVLREAREAAKRTGEQASLNVGTGIVIAVATAIADHLTMQKSRVSRYAFPSIEQLSEKCGGVTGRTIRRALAALEAAGLLCRQIGRGGWRTRYWINGDFIERWRARRRADADVRPVDNSADPVYSEPECPPETDTNVRLMRTPMSAKEKEEDSEKRSAAAREPEPVSQLPDHGALDQAAQAERSRKAAADRERAERVRQAAGAEISFHWADKLVLGHLKAWQAEHGIDETTAIEIIRAKRSKMPPDQVVSSPRYFDAIMAERAARRDRPAAKGMSKGDRKLAAWLTGARRTESAFTDYTPPQGKSGRGGRLRPAFMRGAAL